MMESSNCVQYLPHKVIQVLYLPHKMDDDYVIERVIITTTKDLSGSMTQRRARHFCNLLLFEMRIVYSRLVAISIRTKI